MVELRTDTAFWLKWVFAAVGGFGLAILGMGVARWSGSPVIGWCIGWFSAIAMGVLDRAFVRAPSQEKSK
jgi:hypothetical protein